MYIFHISHPQTDREHFQLGTLSHTLNMKASGYLELSNWPEIAPDPSVRNVEEVGLVCCLFKIAFYTSGNKQL